MTGPGKYDELCTSVREQAQAKCAIVLIFDGKDGSGFSCQCQMNGPLFNLPAVLRDMANEIESDLQK